MGKLLISTCSTVLVVWLSSDTNKMQGVQLHDANLIHFAIDKILDESVLVAQYDGVLSKSAHTREMLFVTEGRWTIYEADSHQVVAYLVIRPAIDKDWAGVRKKTRFGSVDVGLVGRSLGTRTNGDEITFGDFTSQLTKMKQQTTGADQK